MQWSNVEIILTHHFCNLDMFLLMLLAEFMVT
jgi:hypothetical protein